MRRDAGRLLSIPTKKYPPEGSRFYPVRVQGVGCPVQARALHAMGGLLRLQYPLLWIACSALEAAGAYSTDDPRGDHVGVGIERAERSDLEGAVEAFSAAVRFSPGVAENWHNLGTALQDDDYPHRETQSAMDRSLDAFRRHNELKYDTAWHPSGSVHGSGDGSGEGDGQLNSTSDRSGVSW